MKKKDKNLTVEKKKEGPVLNKTDRQIATNKKVLAQLERHKALEFDFNLETNGLTPLFDNTIELGLRTFETTGLINPRNGIGLLKQIYLTSPKGDADWNQISALMHEIGPQDTIEGLLATQMTSAHNMAMYFASRAMLSEQSSEGIDMNINRATKLMRLFTQQLELLNKYRNKGQQQITVQHVNVSQGGQAIVGNVTKGEG